MNLRRWILGCLNSGFKEGGKISSVMLVAFFSGAHLDPRTLLLMASAGFIYGVIEWQQSNPIPDDESVFNPILPRSSTSPKPTDKIDS